jgi:superfamily II DNA or RNA helicase
MNRQYIDKNMATKFFAMFWGREDIFAKRAKNGNYYPQCDNRWNNVLCPKQKGQKMYCEDCEHTSWTKLKPEIIVLHLVGDRKEGTDVIGVYPLFSDGTCRFLVFDFDNHEKGAEKKDFANKDDSWHDEVDALRMICRQNGIEALVERSRSGRGAHVWIFFQKPIAAATARNFGLLLLDKGLKSINLKSFRYYDRMYPSQDATNRIGNLIALPLQGQALKKGNSAFVDENWNAYSDQWGHLLYTRKLSQDEIEKAVDKWQLELSMQHGAADFLNSKNRLKPWKRHDAFAAADVTGKLHIVLADGIYIDALNLKPYLQNQIRCMAAFDNPVFYKNKRLGYSNYYNFSTVYLGEDTEGYIKLPRGLFENIIAECKKAKINYDIEDHREKGRPIRVSFNGELRVQQDLAAESLLAYDNGMLNAATAFGKTVVCGYLIAQRKVNTLILLESTDLISQREEELNRFLIIDEEPPEYQTKTGRIKKRTSVIGTLKGGRDTMTGIIDIAMIGSLYKKGAFHERINTYGMVIMDECHHAASSTAQEVLKKVNARYVYGVSATPIRSDGLEKINYLLLGSVRHKYTALERAEDQGIDHFVYPRYTRVINVSAARGDINAAYAFISNSEVRNELILTDIKDCVKNGRTPLILTKYKEHAKFIYDSVQEDADCVFILYGDNTTKENDSVRRQLKAIPQEKSLILVATGQKVGEGFDYPRLDTLMLGAPVSFPGRLEQYVGRLNRDYDGKQKVIVYDYIDSHIPVFDNMYSKRLRTYKKIGFRVMSDIVADKQNVNAICDAGNYMDIFEQDLAEAEKEIVISSPDIIQKKIDRLIYLMKPRQEAGVKIIVITENPENNTHGNVMFLQSLIQQMKDVGIIVRFTENETEHFAVIDQLLVWHGGMNLLGKEDVWDNLMRVKDIKVAAELLEMALAQGVKHYD